MCFCTAAKDMSYNAANSDTDASSLRVRCTMSRRVGSPVTWETVRDLNGIGALVFSRQVAHEPPPDEEIPQGMGQASWDTDRIGLLAAVGAIGLVQARSEEHTSE